MKIAIVLVCCLLSGCAALSVKPHKESAQAKLKAETVHFYNHHYDDKFVAAAEATYNWEW